jgi:Carboxypeptidase regulatory-like domain
MHAGFRIAAVLLLEIPLTLMAEPIHISGRVQASEGQKQVEAQTIPERGATVFGRVLDPGGKPVPGSRVILGLPDRLTDSEDQATVAETTSDAQGGFAFRHLSPGRLSLGVEHEGFASFTPTTATWRSGRST